jgi:hypothetical protein
MHCRAPFLRPIRNKRKPLRHRPVGAQTMLGSIAVHSKPATRELGRPVRQAFAEGRGVTQAFRYGADAQGSCARPGPLHWAILAAI